MKKEYTDNTYVETLLNEPLAIYEKIKPFFSVVKKDAEDSGYIANTSNAKLGRRCDLTIRELLCKERFTAILLKKICRSLNIDNLLDFTTFKLGELSKLFMRDNSDDFKDYDYDSGSYLDCVMRWSDISCDGYEEDYEDEDAGNSAFKALLFGYCSASPFWIVAESEAEISKEILLSASNTSYYLPITSSDEVPDDLEDVPDYELAYLLNEDDCELYISSNKKGSAEYYFELEDKKRFPEHFFPYLSEKDLVQDFFPGMFCDDFADSDFVKSVADMFSCVDDSSREIFTNIYIYYHPQLGKIMNWYTHTGKDIITDEEKRLFKDYLSFEPFLKNPLLHYYDQAHEYAENGAYFVNQYGEVYSSTSNACETSFGLMLGQIMADIICVYFGKKYALVEDVK